MAQLFESECSYIPLSTILEDPEQAPQSSECSSRPIEPGECSCESDSDTASVFEQILNEYYEELVVEHCISVHQLLKRGSVLDEDNESDNNEKKIDLKQDEDPYDGSSAINVICPNCQKPHSIKTFGSELGNCMNLSTRSSTRISKKKKSTPDMYIEDDEFEEIKRKPAKRKHSSKNGAGRNRAKSTRLLLDTSISNGTYEEKMAFFDQFCGVPTKRDGKNCKKKRTCTLHHEVQKMEIRSTELGSNYTAFMESSPFDRDIVDEPNPYPLPIEFHAVKKEDNKERIILKINQREGKSSM